MPARPFRLSTAIAATAFALAAAPADAIPAYTPDGTECRLSASSAPFAGPALMDPLAYRYDVAHGGQWSFDGTLRYAVLDDGGNASSGDAYEGWGDLFVGATPSEATKYYDDERLGCALEQDGHQLAFRPVTIGDLTVRRSLFVSPERGSGARLVQSVTNPGSAPVTTSVFVGDLRADDSAGGLGSWNYTRVTATSSTPAPAAGADDPIISAADDWAVTTDGDGPDPAIAHVWDGAGGQSGATLARSGTQAGAAPVGSGGTLAKAQLGYAWQDVTIAPGETASFVSWSAQRASINKPFEAALAKLAAEEIATAEPATTFEGMTAAEIASVRNWAKPAPSLAITPVEAATTTSDIALSATGLSFAPDGLPACESGTVRWTFGDGTTATGLSVTRRFPAGTATVQVTATNICGGTRTEQRTFSVASPGNGGQPTPTPTPIDESQPVIPESVGGPETGPAPKPPVLQAPAPSPSIPAPVVPTPPSPAAAPASAEPLSFFAVDRMRMTTMVGKGVATSVVSTVPGKLRVVLSGGGLKMVKTMTLAPGVPRTPTFKLAAKDLPALRRAKTLQVRAKLTLEGGREIIVSRFVAVRK